MRKKDKNNFGVIIFDFVGVLIFKREDYMANKLVDKIDSLIGKVVDDIEFKNEIMNKYNLDEDDFLDILDKIVDKYEPYEKLWKLLSELRKRYKLAIINNGTVLTLPLFEKKYSLKDNFDLFVSSAREGVRKPDRKIFETTVKKLGVDYRDCWFMDDSLENCRVVEKLGMKAIWWNSKEEGFEKFCRNLFWHKKEPLEQFQVKEFVKRYHRAGFGSFVIDDERMDKDKPDRLIRDIATGELCGLELTQVYYDKKSMLNHFGPSVLWEEYDYDSKKVDILLKRILETIITKNEKAKEYNFKGSLILLLYLNDYHFANVMLEDLKKIYEENISVFSKDSIFVDIVFMLNYEETIYSIYKGARDCWGRKI